MRGSEHLIVGDQVQIVPEWQDQGDDQFESFVIVGVNVYIKPVNPGAITVPN